MTGPPVILPPFTEESALRKVQLAQDAWNSRDPDRVALAYTEDSQWRNRDEFFSGRDAIRAFLRRKWQRELDYRLRKELWAFTGNRISVRFEYESRDPDGQWWRSHGNEHWEFDEESGLMRRRDASINDYRISRADGASRPADSPRRAAVTRADRPAPARVEPAPLDPAAAGRHRAPPPPAAGVEEEPAARGPRAAVHAGQARRVGEQRHGVDRDGEAHGARLGRGPRQAPGAVVGGREPRGAAAAAWSRASASRSARRGRRPSASAEKTRCSTSRSARAASSSSSSTTGGRPRTTPSRRPQRARSRGVSSASVLGVSGSPADDQSTLLAKSRHSAPPQSLIVSGVTASRMSYH